MCARALSEFSNVCPPDCVIVHGTTYNVRHFDHPGGRVFVRLAGSMNITELFETSHVKDPGFRPQRFAWSLLACMVLSFCCFVQA